LLGILEEGFSELYKSNDYGKIMVKRVKPTELEVKVLKIGSYRIYSDESSQHVCL
jgi:hypothetical protein